MIVAEKSTPKTHPWYTDIILGVASGGIAARGVEGAVDNLPGRPVRGFGQHPLQPIQPEAVAGRGRIARNSFDRKRFLFYFCPDRYRFRHSNCSRSHA